MFLDFCKIVGGEKINNGSALVKGKTKYYERITGVTASYES